MSIARIVVRLAARVVPSELRAAWREEWLAELWHLERRGAGSIRRLGVGVRFALGSVVHAFAVRKASRSSFKTRGDPMNHLVLDVIFALRAFRRAPGFATLVVLTVGAGIGATTSVFSVVDGVLLRSLPYPEAHELVLVGSTSSRFPGLAPVNPMDFFEWRRENTVFSHLSAVDSYTFDLVDGDQPVRVSGAAVTSEFFDLLRATPALGRTFRPDDDIPTGERVVVVSHDFWQRRFGGDSAVVGLRMRTGEHTFTIIGVMADGFRHPEAFWVNDVDIWMPLSFIDNPLTSRGARFLQVIGRLRTDVSIRDARTEMDGIARSLESQYPENAGRMTLIEPLQRETVGNIGQSLYVLLGAVGLLLMIACVNVANLLLARATVRTREIALQRALGARSGRICQQLLTEGVVLALAGGVIGMALSFGAIELFRAANPVNLPRISEIAVDLRVLTFAALLSSIVGVVFSLTPAVRLARTETTEALKQAGRGTDGATRGRLRHTLVGVEIALAVILVIGAGLLARSFIYLRSVDPGFDPDDVVTMTVNLSNYYDTPESRIQHLEAMAARFRSIPDVLSVGYASSLPFSGDRWLTGFTIEGRERETDDVADYSRVSPGVFATLGITLITGREFNNADRLGNEEVMVVNESFAREYLGGLDVIGRRVGSRGRTTETWYAVVGVVQDVSRNGLDQPADPEFYFSALQRTMESVEFAVRITGQSAPVIDAMRVHAWELDPRMPLRFDSMERALDEALARPRFLTVLLAAFAGLALFLAAVGIYGAMAYTVGQRRHEIGIRLALGASGREVVRMVVRQALMITGLGLLVGVGGALMISRAVEGMLFGVASVDLATYTMAVGVLGCVSIIASIIPARRAGRHSPLIALRTE